ncbi:MAG TPA: sulfatase [Myxococcota bacterium]|nr:sulfatase [Myxococcota bacterium]
MHGRMAGAGFALAMSLAAGVGAAATSPAAFASKAAAPPSVTATVAPPAAPAPATPAPTAPAPATPAPTAPAPTAPAPTAPAPAAPASTSTLTVTAIDLASIVSFADGRLTPAGPGFLEDLDSPATAVGAADGDVRPVRAGALALRFVATAPARHLYVRVAVEKTPAKMSVTLDGKRLGDAVLETASAAYDFALPAPLAAGDHRLALGLPKGASLGTITLADEPPPDEAPGILALAAGECLRFYVPWPAGGALTSDAGPGALTAAVVETDTTGAAPAAGDATRITLCGPAVIAGPRVVVPAPPPPPPSRPASPESAAASAGPAARNALVVMLDSTRADVVPTMRRPGGAAGVARTPTIDALAAEGVRFTDLTAASSYSRPTTTSFFTSLYPRVHGFNGEDDHAPVKRPELSRVLQAAGLVTLAADGSGYALPGLGHHWTHYALIPDWPTADQLVDRALALLAKVPAGERFFLFVLLVDAHLPYTAPPDVIRSYYPEKYKGFVTPLATSGIATRVKGHALRLEGEHFRYYRALYDASVTWADAQIARLVEALRARGALDDTLVLVTADHGEEFLEHGSIGHGHALYDEQTHIPLVMRLPGAAAAGTVRATPVEQVDLAPTVLDALGVAAPASFQGESLLPLALAAADPLVPSPTFAEMVWHGAAVRFGRHKLYVRYKSKYLPREYFDLGEDPFEKTDRAAARPIAVRLCTLYLDAWRKGVDGVHKAAGGRLVAWVPLSAPPPGRAADRPPVAGPPPGAAGHGG